MNIQVKTWENIIYLVVHHTGGVAGNPFASTAHHKAKDVNEWHRQRWPEFKSGLGFWGGYNCFIEHDGKLVQFRKIGEETAAQVGHNKDTFSVCLAGNFIKKGDGTPVDTPSEAQIATLRGLLEWAYQTGNIRFEHILPHRALGFTGCYGDYLPDDWARNLVKDKRAEALKELSALERLIEELRAKVAALRRTLGGRPSLSGLHGRG